MTEPDITAEVRAITAELDRIAKTVVTAKDNPTRFVAVSGTPIVMLGSMKWARCRSNTAAIRTANALNAYVADERGR